jgi:pseudouridylate synthase
MVPRVTAPRPGGDDPARRGLAKARFRVSAEVAEALASSRPVVALETTLVTHGLPHPDGLAAAAELEAAVRAEGAVPATIGVLDGHICAGLSALELERLATSPGVTKLNLSNLAAQLAGSGAGSTTVAATMFAAHHLGIRVFATGGIGGVHRDAATTGDVSADLTALARFPVAVVCAGAKAVLDLPKTVEALETLGVPVFGWETDRFPAFYRRDSGLRVDQRFDSLDEMAEAITCHFDLGLGTGVVIANAIPVEHEMPAQLYERSLAQALLDAAEAGGTGIGIGTGSGIVKGRDVTPFLLDRLRALTEGASLPSNRALLMSNARLAARLAGHLSA